MESDKSISAPSDVNSDSVPRTRPLHGRTSGPARRSTKGQWTAEEDEILRKAVQRFKGKNWKKIAECFKDRTDVQCLHRWQKVLNPELIKGPWSKEEDETIIELVKKFGPKKWSTIAQHLAGRIGKQCRERWHNHLNPAINKEAWTQEEELALIRAHQIYGNRWAELTKFLPGRTDNAIKNHWNSSVKKKLDSYLSSGLLEQLPAIPLVAHQSQNVASCSSRIQTSGDNGGQKAEEVSECSQESVVGCSQAANDFANPVLHAREEFQFNEESGFRNEQISSPASCSEQHYTSLRDVPFSIPEVPCEAGASSFLQNNFPYNSATSASMNYQVNLQELPNISSLQLCQESSGMPIHSIISHDNHELMNFPFETSAGDIAAKGDQMFISDEEFCRILFSDAVNAGTFSPGGNFSPGTVAKGSHMLDLDEATDPLLHPSSDIKVSEGDKPSAIQSYCPSTSGALGTSSSQPILSSPMLLTANDITLANQSINIQVSEGDRPAALQTYVPAASGVLGTSCSHSVLSTPMLLAAGDNTLASQSVNHSFGTQREEVTTIVHDDFIYANDNVNTPGGDGTYDTDLQEQPYLEEAKKLVPVSSFNSGVGTVQSNPATEMPDIQMEQQDAGALCYEPPRFPSFDIPFLSCDLIPAGGDIQQEYSPLGIRQLMMSSMNCISPFRLWGSPARDDSPDAVLRSAAKTFTGTPSILKKRTRDLLSPLSDRRDDKKLEIDMTSNLTKEFSRLDVMFDEAATQRAPIQSPSFDRRSNGSSSEDKENRDPALDSRQEEGSDATTALSENKTSHKDVARSNSEENRLQLVADSNTYNCGPPNPCMEKPLGVLLDDNLQEILLFSPDQVGFKADRVFGSNTRTPRNLYRKILGTLSEQAISETSSGNPCLVVSSPSVGRKKNDSLSVIATTSAQSLPSSAALNNVLDSAENYAGIESLSIFGETPFKRSFESPSAWKSPWFINSFLPGPKVDTDISIEDIGYFSPADRSYDAIALIKQLNGHTASAYADALEVLGNETPETLSKRKGANNQTADQENNHHSQLASNVMSECRILDFSECGTPKKGTESRKTSSSSNLSSPSSYLLKGCR